MLLKSRILTANILKEGFMVLDKGDKFPDFKMPNQKEEMRSLQDYTGSWLVAFFYSKDNTSACTQEVAEFCDLYKDFAKLGANIIGISRDTVKSHAKFAEKLGIEYDLLTDTDREFAAQTGLLKEKKMYGKPVIGVNRSTFIIDAKGIIQKALYGVKAKDHAKEVLKELNLLNKS